MADVIRNVELVTEKMQVAEARQERALQSMHAELRGQQLVMHAELRGQLELLATQISYLNINNRAA